MTILTPHLGGWRSDDGYSFTVSAGRVPIGHVTRPDGTISIVIGGKHEGLVALLERAEREICRHRAGRGA